jgi:hypothetical protein
VLPNHAGKNVPNGIHLHGLQIFRSEAGVDEFRPFHFVEAGSGNLLDGNGQIK